MMFGDLGIGGSMNRRKKDAESAIYVVSAAKRDRRARSEMVRREARRMFAYTRELQLNKAS